jgi:phosphohistidine phosphatase
MRVHLCRHAEAEAGDPDALRELTAGGVAQAHALGATLAGVQPPPQIVLASPLLRARQTAAIVAEATGATVLVDTRLAPGATLEGLREALRGLPGPVATVGHQPDCSEIAQELTGIDPGFPVAGSTEIELDL